MNGSIIEEIERLQNDPVWHVEEFQGVKTLEPFQKDILRAISDNERVCISACHDIGKTFTLAKAVLWMGSVFPGAKIITTAPTFLQVEKLLWSEIRAGYKNSAKPLGGIMLTTSWKLDHDWFALGFSPKEDAGPVDIQGSDSRFQGFHGKLTVIIFDEATGVTPKRYIQTGGMMTSGHVKWICIGNPTTKNSPFFKLFGNPMWKKIKLNCFDSPNLIANGITNKADLFSLISEIEDLPDDDKLSRIKSFKIVKPHLLTLQWVVGAALEYSTDSPYFVSKALGEFPDEDSRSIITMSQVETAQRRTGEKIGVRSMGIDPARFGPDKTVITIIEGNQQTYRKALKGYDTVEVVGFVVDLINKFTDHYDKEIICVDATGLGSGVFDLLKENRQLKIIPQDIILRECHFGASCIKEKDKKKFVNLKAKIFIDLRDDLKKDLAIIADDVYLGELPSIISKFDSKGRYVIESKDEYKKRTGLKSPDNADSLALANFGRHNAHEVGNFDKSMSDTSTDGTGFDGTLVGSGYGDNW